MAKVSDRAQKIPPFIVMDVLERAYELEKEGREIIHLEIGEPDFSTPRSIRDAAVDAIADEKTHYTHSLGIPELREAICSHYLEKYGADITPDRILVTAGTSPAMFILFSTLLGQDDEIIIPDPHYPCYPNFIRFLGGRPVFVNVYEDDGFQYSTVNIRKKITSRTKAIVINSPSNPTGSLLHPDRMREIAELGLPIISDEIYHGLVYGEKEHSILEFAENAFVLNGFSKFYAMTGWRVGYIISPGEYIRPMQKIQQNFIISAGSISQYAALEALSGPQEEVGRMVSAYDERRKYMLSRLREMGLSVAVEPKGAFYIFANAGRFSRDSYKLAFEILENAGVGVCPGIDFGKNAEGYLRFSYANSIENIKRGLDRIEEYLKT